MAIQPSTQPFSTYQKILIGMFIGIALLFHAMRFNLFPVGAYQDDAYYLILAEGLVSGRGFVMVNEPNPLPHGIFPPGWPFLLAPITWLAEGKYGIIKLMNSLFWLGSLLLILSLLKKRLSASSTVAYFGLIALNTELIFFSTTHMSEISYLFFSLMIFYFYDQISDVNNLSLKKILMICIISFYAQLIRAIGITLFASVIIYLSLLIYREKQWKKLCWLYAFTAFLIGFQIYFNMTTGGGLITQGYEDQILAETGILERFLQIMANVREYAAGKLMFPVVPLMDVHFSNWLWENKLVWLKHLIGLTLIGIMVLGFVMKFREWLPLNGYLVLYFIGVLSFWNSVVGSSQYRFIVPIVPFLIYYFVEGMQFLVIRLKLKVHQDKVMMIICGVLIFLSIYRNIESIQYPIRQYFTDISAGRNWIQENTEADTIVYTVDPIPDYLYLRRKTLPYPLTAKPLTNADFSKANYLLLAPPLRFPPATSLEPSQMALLQYLESSKTVFPLVYRDDKKAVRIYALPESF